RKILYTMYKMGLLTGPRSKSANIVGRTMQLNPHGDAAIYETMVRLSRGYEALLHPFVDSKGNFGKAYSRDMMWAASRYTEAKLEAISAELFRDIDKDTVDFVDNYDNTMKEPTLLPVTFPTVLVNSNTGIAVGMASSICSFNLEEVCRTTIELIRNPDHCVTDTLKAPDFAGGAKILYDREKTEEIYRTGRGSFKLYAKYSYDKANNCIDITEIPMTSTSTSESIIEKVIDRVRAGVIKEINDIRDETDKTGLKITIDLKRGVDPDKLMQKLYRITPLSDSFACNFNVLIAGTPRVMGVAELLNEWIAFRTECVRRRTYFDLKKAKERLHLLRGLEKILLDIDKAIKIVRNTQEESEVVPNLMIGFGIDKVQAEFVAEIKLRHLNREYILKRTQDIEDLEKQVADLEDILAKKGRVGAIIISELEEVIKKYGQPRKTEIIYASDVEEEEEEEQIPDYPVTLFFSKEGYFKKITPQSLRMSSEQKFKEGDSLLQTVASDNAKELLFFTNKCQVYKARVNDFKDTKASSLGDYVASKLGMDEGETAVYMVATSDYAGYMLFFFENGEVAKVELSAYMTKNNRHKLIGAYSDKSPLVAILYMKEDGEVLLPASSGRKLLVHTGAITPKTTRSTIGVQAMTLKGKHLLT
ncbi:MAG: topoisomerase IV, partial [Oscillospiraceae bacterium]|nr:topoisomerase IV [Oscillospiraceae bacterium]